MKPTAKIKGGMVATFVTIEEEARIIKKRSEKEKRDKKAAAAAAAATAHATGGAMEEGETGQKVPKDLSSLAHRMLQVQTTRVLLNIERMPNASRKQEK